MKKLTILILFVLNFSAHIALAKEQNKQKIDDVILDDIEEQILAKQKLKQDESSNNEQLQEKDVLDSIFKEIVENEESMNISEDDIFDDTLFTH